MARLRFPSNSQNDESPYVVFTTHKAQYNNVGSKIDSVETGNSVALYFPANYTVSDSFNYQTESTGLVGAAVESFRSGRGSSITEEDVQEVAKAALTNKNSAAVLTGLGAAGIASLGLSGFSSLLGGAAVGSAVGNVAAEFAKEEQVALNPREFMLFKSPNIRTFSFSFNLIPSNENEIEAIPNIIKFFRKAAYPSLHSVNAVYNFPEAFNINIGNSDSVIKIPEVFCEGVNVAYNPNSMSYFRVDNLPVEINLGLSFKEIKPINKAFVDLGY